MQEIEQLKPGETELVRLISITPDAEKSIAYCARVSNPKNQENPKIAGLLKYCVENGHWSIFEQANMVLEITTSRAIAPQILRHRSFTFQEFSQRYSVATNHIKYNARRQDNKNRQNSIDDLDDDTQRWFLDAQEQVWDKSRELYEEALGKGIAKECARTLLPLGTLTTLYMNGTIRSWMHYIGLRTGHGTQKEHMKIAEECRNIFKEQLPITAEAMGWTNSPVTSTENK